MTVMTLNPKLIVIGGELSAAGDVLLDPIRRARQSAVLWRVDRGGTRPARQDRRRPALIYSTKDRRPDRQAVAASAATSDGSSSEQD
jgi:predicted NBD/HSP70 family sugar kinase